MTKKVISYLFSLLILWMPVESKVYDCFPFFNEMELLKMRLEELNDSVDYFVLVESIETQRGDLKPLYFKENQHLFTKYLPKIIHIAIEERHPEMSLWEREHYQRNCIMRGLKGCNDFDVILISDLDEIPRPALVKQFPVLLFKEFVSDIAQKCKDILSSPFKQEGKKQKKNKYRNPSFGIQMPIYFYQLNRIPTTGELWDGMPWIGTIATYYRNVAKKQPQYFRDRRYELHRIDKGGWHFTWMGGKDKIRQKMSSVVEGRADGQSLTDEEIEQWIQSYPVVPIDDHFPSYMLKNQEYLRSIGFIAPY